MFFFRESNLALKGEILSECVCFCAFGRAIFGELIMSGNQKEKGRVERGVGMRARWGVEFGN